MKKERLFIDFIFDIYQQTHIIKKFLINKTYQDFVEDTQLFYAICRCLEIIGEAVKKIPRSVTQDYNEINWSEIAKMRDILIHYYYGADERIIWNVCKLEIEPLRNSIQQMASIEIDKISDSNLKKILLQKMEALQNISMNLI
jgi:uncharacterized protein with HEPN domain